MLPADGARVKAIQTFPHWLCGSFRVVLMRYQYHKFYTQIKHGTWCFHCRVFDDHGGGGIPERRRAPGRPRLKLNNRTTSVHLFQLCCLELCFPQCDFVNKQIQSMYSAAVSCVVLIFCFFCFTAFDHWNKGTLKQAPEAFNVFAGSIKIKCLQ